MVLPSVRLLHVRRGLPGPGRIGVCRIAGHDALSHYAGSFSLWYRQYPVWERCRPDRSVDDQRMPDRPPLLAYVHARPPSRLHGLSIPVSLDSNGLFRAKASEPVPRVGDGLRYPDEVDVPVVSSSSISLCRVRRKQDAQGESPTLDELYPRHLDRSLDSGAVVPRPRNRDSKQQRRRAQPGGRDARGIDRILPADYPRTGVLDPGAVRRLRHHSRHDQTPETNCPASPVVRWGIRFADAHRFQAAQVFYSAPAAPDDFGGGRVGRSYPGLTDFRTGKASLDGRLGCIAFDRVCRCILCTSRILPRGTAIEPPVFFIDRKGRRTDSRRLETVSHRGDNRARSARAWNEPGRGSGDPGLRLL